jgi:hypothetical protein
MEINGVPFDWDGFLATLRQRAASFNPIWRTNKWECIRRAYEIAMPDIMSHERICPYILDWVRFFTPIERLAWYDIRYHCVPLYPQFPVLNYFIDFANPRMKIGLELDGAAWHDRDKDTRRDRHLMQHDWKIFRVTGSEAYRTRELIQNDDGEYDPHRLQDWYMNTSEGVIKAINDVYFDYNPYKHNYLAIRTLRAHKLADFEVCPEVVFEWERPAETLSSTTYEKGGEAC